MHNFHNKWSQNQLETELAENGKPRIELDESKLVTFDNQVRWMLFFVERNIKEVVLIYYINNNLTKEKILPIVKKNVYSYQRKIINNNDPDENFPATRIYIDCLSIYQELIDLDIYYIELIT